MERQLALLRGLAEGELRRILDEEASPRLGRRFQRWEDLARLFVVPRVARGLRPRLTQAQYEELERRRRAGDYRGYDDLERERRPDLRDARVQADLPEPRPVVSWEQVRGGWQRAVVLGDPGFGKTMLLWHESGRRARQCQDRVDEDHASPEAIELAVCVRADRLATWIGGCDDPLPRIAVRLLRLHRLPADGQIREFLAGKIASGQCLIAVDAMDEVPVSRSKLDAALATLGRQHPHVRLLLSSRLAGYTPLPPALVSEQDEMELLAFEEQQMRSALDAWLADGSPVAAERLWGHIQQQGYVKEDLRCPLLLRLACRAAETAQKEMRELPRWERRSDLYTSFLEDAVKLWAKRAKPRPKASQVAMFLSWASAVALALCRQNAHRTLWAPSDVQKVIEGLEKQWGMAARKHFLDDLRDAGILVPCGQDEPGTRCMFTHRSFGECLAAMAWAAELASGGGWNPVKRTAWDPDWQEVLVFLSAHLGSKAAETDNWNTVETFYQCLLEEDDYFRHRLVLAVRCLPNTSQSAPLNLAARFGEIATSGYAFWRGHRDSRLRLAHTNRVLASIRDAAVPIEGQPIWKFFRGLLRSRDEICVFEAVAALRELVPVPNADVLSELVQLLVDPYSIVDARPVPGLYRFGPLAVRNQCAHVIGGSGEHITPQHLVLIAEVLQSPDPEAGEDVAVALAKMGPIISESLLQRAQKEFKGPNCPRLPPVRVPSRVPGGTARAPSVGERISRVREGLELPFPADERRRGQELKKLWMMARQKTLHAINAWAADPNPVIRTSLASLPDLWPAGALPLVAIIVSLAADSDSPVRKTTAAAIAGTGASVTRSMIGALETLLRDPDGAVKDEALVAATVLCEKARLRLFWPPSGPPYFRSIEELV